MQRNVRGDLTTTQRKLATGQHNTGDAIRMLALVVALTGCLLTLMLAGLAPHARQV